MLEAVLELRTQHSSFLSFLMSIYFWRQNVCVRMEGKGGNLGMEVYLLTLTMN